MENKITLIRTLKHLNLITKHRLVVFKLSCKIGIPWRGLVHDLSKYSPTEFWEGVKYFNGKHSPITDAKKDKGYSDAWLHHKGRNKHHTEYWTDESAPNNNPFPPYKYVAEMLCDKTAAGMIYNGKEWKDDVELKYYMYERTKIHINKNLDELFIEFFTKLGEDGINKSFNKHYVEELYKKYYEKEKDRLPKGTGTFDRFAK